MSVEIEGIDKGNLAEWAFAQMYAAMRDAEQNSKDYNHNADIVARSLPGDRTIPRQADLDNLAGNTKFFMQRAEMYAAIFTACEVADDSPNRDKYMRAIRAVDALRAAKQIPQQRERPFV